MAAYMTREGNWLILSVPQNQDHILKRATWAIWDRERRKWVVKKPNATIYTSIVNTVPNLVVHNDVKELIEEITIKKEAINSIKESGWGSVEPQQPLPLKEGVKPFQHQRAGYEIACRILGL